MNDLDSLGDSTNTVFSIPGTLFRLDDGQEGEVGVFENALKRFQDGEFFWLQDGTFYEFNAHF